MKSLKITFLLLAVLFMTMSGTSSDQLVSNENDNIKKHEAYHLLAHDRSKVKLPTNG